MANVKLGNNTLTGVDTVKLENADQAGSYVTFSEGGATPEQEKGVTITENGTTEVTPDDNYTLSKVTINVNVPTPTGIPTGTVNKYALSTAVKYIYADSSANPYRTFPLKDSCPYSSNDADSLYVVFNDGHELPISKSDVFEISYTLPENISSGFTDNRINKIKKVYEYAESFTNLSGEALKNLWTVTIHIYKDDVELSSGIPHLCGFASSSTSTSTTSCVYAVDNWELKLNNIKQENVMGIKVVGQYASHFDDFTISTAGKMVNKGIAVPHYASVTNYRYFGNSSESSYYIMNGLIQMSSSSQIASNYPLLNIKSTLFTE